MYTQRFTGKKTESEVKHQASYTHTGILFMFSPTHLSAVITCGQLNVFLWYEINISHTRQVGFLYSKSCPLAACHTIHLHIIRVQEAKVTLATRMSRSFSQRQCFKISRLRVFGKFCPSGNNILHLGNLDPYHHKPISFTDYCDRPRQAQVFNFRSVEPVTYY